MRLSAVVQPPHLHLVCFEHAALDEQRDGLQRVPLVEQFVTGHVAFFSEIEEVGERLQLLRSPLQHVEGYVESLLGTELGSEPYIGLGLGTIAVLGLQSRRQSRLVDFADGRHVVVGYPLPQPILLGKQYRLCINQLQYILDLVARRLVVVQGCHYSHIVLAAPERHQHTASWLYALLPLRRQGVGKGAVERQGEYDISKVHQK